MKGKYVLAASGLAVAFSLLYWISDSVLQYRNYSENLRYVLFNEPLTVSESIFFKIPPHQLITRLFFFGFCFLGAGLVLVFINRWQKSEQKFKTYVESAPNAIIAFNETGIILDVNEAATRLLHYSSDEFFAINISSITSGIGFMERIPSEGETTEHMELKRKDGSNVSSVLKCREIAKNRYIGIFTDITGLVEAKNSIQHLNRVLFAIQDINKAISRETDVESLISFACASLTRNLGYQRAWITLNDKDGNPKYTGRSGFPEPLPDHVAKELLPYTRDCLSTGELTIVENSSNLEDSDWETIRMSSVCIPLKWQEHVHGAAAVSIPSKFVLPEQEKQLLCDLADDLSHALHSIDEAASRRRAEEALVLSEEKYRLITDNTIDCITQMNSDYVFTFINPAVEQVLGFLPDEWVGTSLDDHVEPTWGTTIRNDIQEASENGLNEIRSEVEFLHKNGHPVPMEVSAKLFHDNRTGDILLQGVARDLTQKYDSEKKQRQIEHQLRQAQKMEAIGQLAGGVAHDFNNILQSITGFSEIALSASKDSPELQGYISEIMRGSERAASLTRQLLAFSRKQILQKRTIDLNSIVSNIMKMIRRIIGENIELKMKMSSEFPLVSADVAQIEQVILNLCLNARDSMAEGGELTISTSKSEIEKLAVLQVQDTGAGMDGATAAKIFEPFFTTKKPGKGTGLGLSTVIGIIQQHDGTIFVESKPGKGSVFTINLPLVESEEYPDLRVVKKELPPSRGVETVLIVEDDPTVRKLAETIVANAGYNVFTAEDGYDALKVFKVEEKKIDVILSDILMPGMGGKELYASIEKITPMKFLFMSGYSSGTISDSLLSKNNVDFIRKPFGAANLQKSLRQLLDS